LKPWLLRKGMELSAEPLLGFRGTNLSFFMTASEESITLLRPRNASELEIYRMGPFESREIQWCCERCPSLLLSPSDLKNPALFDSSERVLMVVCRFYTDERNEMDRDETGQRPCTKGLVLPDRSLRIRPFPVAENVAKWDILPVDTEETTPPLY
jgi:hypothetical protein